MKRFFFIGLVWFVPGVMIWLIHARDWKTAFQSLVLSLPFFVLWFQMLRDKDSY